MMKVMSVLEQDRRQLKCVRWFWKWRNIQKLKVLYV